MKEKHKNIFKKLAPDLIVGLQGVPLAFAIGEVSALIFVVMTHSGNKLDSAGIYFQTLFFEDMPRSVMTQLFFLIVVFIMYSVTLGEYVFSCF